MNPRAAAATLLLPTANDGFTRTLVKVGEERV